MASWENDRYWGPIKGFWLPQRVWAGLVEEGITTLEQLRAIADRLETIPGIGPKSAQVIREQLVRLDAPDREPPET
jgi:hypothetical protein